MEESLYLSIKRDMMITKKLRKKLKKNSFKINLLETTIFLIKDKDMFQSIYDDIEYNSNTNDVHGLCLSTVNEGIKDIYIGLFCNRDDVLVHECVHASLYMLSNIEENANEDSELQPFLVQTLFRESKKVLKRISR